MPRQKKEKFEYVASLKRFRKRVKDADGKYISIYGKTEDELRAKLEEARQEIQAGLQIREDPTVADYAKNWLPGVTAEMGDKYKESFEGAIRIHVVPVIGHLRLRDVRPDDAQLVMTKLAGKSKSLQGKVLNAMRRMFANAMKNKLIRENPCDDLKAGGKKPKKKKPLTPAQMQTLLDAVKGTRADTFVRLGLFAGLRREESMGLLWDDVHLDAPTPYLEIHHVVIYPKNGAAVKKDIPKTDDSNRTIPITDPELLDHLQEKRQKHGYVVGGGSEPYSYHQYANLWAIVERRQTGTGYFWDKQDGKNVRRTFERKLGQRSRGGDFCYTIDFEVTSHVLRHTRATNWIRSGVDPKTVQYLLGHSDPDLTLEIYAHVVEESPEALAEAITNPMAFRHQNQANLEVNVSHETTEP